MGSIDQYPLIHWVRDAEIGSSLSVVFRAEMTNFLFTIRDESTGLSNAELGPSSAGCMKGFGRVPYPHFNMNLGSDDPDLGGFIPNFNLLLFQHVFIQSRGLVNSCC